MFMAFSYSYIMCFDHTYPITLSCLSLAPAHPSLHNQSSTFMSLFLLSNEFGCAWCNAQLNAMVHDHPPSSYIF